MYIYRNIYIGKVIPQTYMNNPSAEYEAVKYIRFANRMQSKSI